MSSVSLQIVDDILTAAWEGGSSYWAEAALLRLPTRIRHRDTVLDTDGRTYAGEIVANGGWYAIGERGDFDDPSEMPWHPLDLDRLRAGIRRAAEHFGYSVARFYDEHDAGMADVALQFAVLGDLVYG